MTADPISADLKSVLRRLRLSRVLDTLPERLTLVRQQPLPHQDFLLLILTDEVTRRDSLAATLRAQRAGLDPSAQLEHWDTTARVTFDRALLTELVTLRFLETHHHVALVGPVGVGKTFLAHALGHIACRRGHSVLALFRRTIPLHANDRVHTHLRIDAQRREGSKKPAEAPMLSTPVRTPMP